MLDILFFIVFNTFTMDPISPSFLIYVFALQNPVRAFWGGMPVTETFSVLSSPKMYTLHVHMWVGQLSNLENCQGIVPLPTRISNCYWHHWEVWLHDDSYFILCASFPPLILLASLLYPVYPENLPQTYCVYSLFSH